MDMKVPVGRLKDDLLQGFLWHPLFTSSFVKINRRGDCYGLGAQNLPLLFFFFITPILEMSITGKEHENYLQAPRW